MKRGKLVFYGGIFFRYSHKRTVSRKPLPRFCSLFYIRGILRSTHGLGANYAVSQKVQI
jgi:hypothetical protein